MTRDAIRTGLVQVFGGRIGIGLTDPASPDHRLRPGERAAVAKAVPKRVREFAAGRAAARAAFAELGLQQPAIPVAADRSPVWPGGISGSISHTDELCLAVVSDAPHWRAIGLDAEATTPLSPDIWDIVLTPEELRAVGHLPQEKRGHHGKLIFCIKEAAYKAQYPVSKTIFDFQTLAVELKGHRFRAEFRRDVPPFRNGVTIQGVFFEADGHFVAGAILPNA
ncbi:4'-phosphopantetheinyl transferase family protein [Thalassovita aquimarina]|uniref:Enterobactin synthase component D n=1 Tax=Thalassovita aquimarina TaxID=2785917 RepID=A0ABS5HNM0_9RHOB|nr:4'-phosphopantetheinyl transferase superfamily protein [Thalassovita aquimarina]MBR9650560.1 4'-phosphopantetheinyl transferase superfamily protein [Thalassovita aquimarina]